MSTLSVHVFSFLCLPILFIPLFAVLGHAVLQSQMSDMEVEVQRLTEENLRLNSESQESVSRLNIDAIYYYYWLLLSMPRNTTNDLTITSLLLKSAELRRQLTIVQHELSEAVTHREQAIQNEQAAKHDLSGQAQLARDCQDKYERELVLHAADVKSLTQLKEQVR